MRPLRTVMLALALLASGCSAIPTDGPSRRQVERGGERDAAEPIPYTLITLDAPVAAAVLLHANATRPAAEDTRLAAGRPLGQIGIGDTLQVTMWEPNPTSGTLFERPGTNVTVRVGQDGTVAVPFAGRIRVADRSPAQAEAAILAEARSQSASVQVSLLTIEDQTNAVIVQGEVARPGRVALSPGSGRLLDVLALAGGARLPDHLAIVRITRGGVTITREMSRLVADPAADLQLAPGDRVQVSPIGRHFYAFGAVNRPGEQPYQSDEMSLAQSLGRMAGLQDARADPAAVFLFRRQPADLTRRLLTDAKQGAGDLTQVVFQVNMADPNSFFVMQNFRVEPNDIVYVSQSRITEITKFLQILVSLSSTVQVGRNLGTGF
jgi:polysaccharide export outer membrane protein